MICIYKIILETNRGSAQTSSRHSVGELRDAPLSGMAAFNDRPKFTLGITKDGEMRNVKHDRDDILYLLVGADWH